MFTMYQATATERSAVCLLAEAKLLTHTQNLPVYTSPSDRRVHIDENCTRGPKIEQTGLAYYKRALKDHDPCVNCETIATLHPWIIPGVSEGEFDTVEWILEIQEILEKAETLGWAATKPPPKSSNPYIGARLQKLQLDIRCELERRAKDYPQIQASGYALWKFLQQENHLRQDYTHFLHSSLSTEICVQTCQAQTLEQVTDSTKHLLVWIALSENGNSASDWESLNWAMVNNTPILWFDQADKQDSWAIAQIPVLHALGYTGLLDNLIYPPHGWAWDRFKDANIKQVKTAVELSLHNNIEPGDVLAALMACNN